MHLVIFDHELTNFMIFITIVVTMLKARSGWTRLQKLYDLDGPQPTDAPYKSWYQDGTTDSGRPQSRKSSIAAMIRAGYPTQD
jgi:hypothetical protein